MNDKDEDLSNWLSTYGILTAQSILERFTIHINLEDISTSVKDSNSIYHQLLRVPLKNIFNGIIVQQAYDYQVFAQKIFIEYFLSGQSDLPEDAPGASIRVKLDDERTLLLHLNDVYNKQELNHRKLIAESQGELIKQGQAFKYLLNNITVIVKSILQAKKVNASDFEIQKSVNHTLIKCKLNDQNSSSDFGDKLGDEFNTSFSEAERTQLSKAFREFHQQRRNIDSVLSYFFDQSEEMTTNLRDIRKQLYELIVRTRELIQLLPGAFLDEKKENENREDLNFDMTFGE